MSTICLYPLFLPFSSLPALQLLLDHAVMKWQQSRLPKLEVSPDLSLKLGGQNSSSRLLYGTKLNQIELETHKLESTSGRD